MFSFLFLPYCFLLHCSCTHLFPLRPSSLSLLSCISPYFAAVCIFYADDSKTSDTGGQLQTEGELFRSFLVAHFLSSDALYLPLNLSPPLPILTLLLLLLIPPSLQFVAYFLSLPHFFPSSPFFIVILSPSPSLSHCLLLVPQTLLGNPTNWKSSANWTQ